MKSSELAFGLKSAGVEAPVLWGARAIYTGLVVDLLPDRQDMVGTEEDRKAFREKMNAGPLRKFIRWAKDRFEPSRADVEAVVIGGVEFTCSTNASYGYLYITARPAPEGSVETEVPPVGICKVCGAALEVKRGKVPSHDEPDRGGYGFYARYSSTRKCRGSNKAPARIEE